jgi:hypothetical protein
MSLRVVSVLHSCNNVSERLTASSARFPSIANASGHDVMYDHSDDLGGDLDVVEIHGG